MALVFCLHYVDNAGCSFNENHTYSLCLVQISLQNLTLKMTGEFFLTGWLASSTSNMSKKKKNKTHKTILKTLFQRWGGCHLPSMEYQDEFGEDGYLNESEANHGMDGSFASQPGFATYGLTSPFSPTITLIAFVVNSILYVCQVEVYKTRETRLFL